MASSRSSAQIAFPLSHLPTWFFIIGYPLFWLQLFTHTARQGITGPWGWIIFGLAAGAVLRRGSCKPSFNIRTEKYFWLPAFLLAAVIITIAALAALKPIHLLQESDCMKYHYTLPRQHLIAGSFAHIPWASDDLFLLPMDFALAPFWFATVLPNKLPQLIIFFGLIAVAIRLTSILGGERRPWAGPLMALAILGTHGFGIQMGTGMLDLGITYLFLASLDSLRTGQWILAGVEFTFFFWCKPLMPLEVLLTGAIFAVLWRLGHRAQWFSTDTIPFMRWRRAVGLFLILSVIVAGPFIVKSFHYAGTPFYPFVTGISQTAAIKNDPIAWQSLERADQAWMSIKNNYGHGKGFLPFIRHWWLIAVPEKGVNNAFDYPLGLTYLLLIGPFLFFLFQDISQRKFSALGVLVAVVWMLWWFSTQQTRFLYIPLLLIFMVTITRLESLPKGLGAGILISLLLQTFSLWDAHKMDLRRWGVDVLRGEDKQLVELSGRYIKEGSSQPIEWTSHDVAYAQFPVMVRQENLPYTLATD
jgi:hypothetical protein